MTRPDLQRLAPVQIAPLEACIAAFPEAWQDFARSCYCTLLGRSGWPGAALPQAKLTELAEQAASMAMGIGEDLGGAQPYIPVGNHFAVGEKCGRVVRAWRAGHPWKHIAEDEKLTERRVRQIVTAWQQETFARSQGRLDLSN